MFESANKKMDVFFFEIALKNGRLCETQLPNVDIFGNKKNDPRFKGITSSSKNGVTTIEKGIFTSCKKNDKCPPWSVQANKITYDKNKKQILYDNALIKVYDIPIIYFPKFFHPGPSVKRQSGFLMPQVIDSSSLGLSFKLPYYKVISENKDPGTVM